MSIPTEYYFSFDNNNNNQYNKIGNNEGGKGNNDSGKNNNDDDCDNGHGYNNHNPYGCGYESKQSGSSGHSSITLAFGGNSN